MPITPSHSTKTRRKLGPGWIPNYHGGWAMVTVPILMGVMIGGFRWEHVLLLAFWWVGYFAFFAGALWLRSGRRPKYFPPVGTYTTVAIALGVGTLIAAPYLAWWALAFSPLVGITVWASTHRKDRSLINTLAAVSAACLMLAVAYDLGTRGAGNIWGNGCINDPEYALTGLPGTSVDGSIAGWPWVWTVTALVAWYFIGTISYVKTNIRERGSAGWLVASGLFHSLGLALVATLTLNGFVSTGFMLVWIVIFVRSMAVPLYGRTRSWLPAPAIGFGEVALSIAVMVTLL